MLKELCLFGAGCAAGAAVMYYGSETVKNNIQEAQASMNQIMGMTDELGQMVAQYNAELEQSGQVAANYQPQNVQQQYVQQPIQQPAPIY